MLLKLVFFNYWSIDLKCKPFFPSSDKLLETAEKLKNEGNVFYKAGEYRKSIDLYNQAIGLLSFKIKN